jgi:hypothetical protein
MHKVFCLNFTSMDEATWKSFPTAEQVRKHIALAVLAHSNLTEEALGFFRPPKEIREVKVTEAVHDQVRCMWHGHRDWGKKSPPPIPLKIFVFGYGQDAKSTWANIEVLPGLDCWEVE